MLYKGIFSIGDDSLLYMFMFAKKKSSQRKWLCMVLYQQNLEPTSATFVFSAADNITGLGHNWSWTFG